MRIVFSLIGLLVVLGIVGFLAKSRLPAVTQLPNSAANSSNVAEQSKQIQTQVKDQVNEVMRAAAEAQQKALDGGNIDKNADKPAEKTGLAY